MIASAGPEVAKSMKNKKLLNAFGSVVAALEGATSPLVDQPVLNGLQSLFKGYQSGDMVNNLIMIGLSTPTQFIPSIVNQIRQTRSGKLLTCQNGIPGEAIRLSLPRISL
jgi:hypothetical protein